MIEQLSEHLYYLPGAVNCVIVTSGKEAILIDTGQDKDSGRRLRKACEQLGVKPSAIINSHAHADHYGGNAYLLGQFDVPVYAPDFERAIMQEPYLEPVYLFSGAKPPKAMQSKWLMAKASRVNFGLEAGTLRLLDLELAVIDTSGHAHRQCSFLIDDVLVAADAIFGDEVLAKYPLPFGQDIARQQQSATDLLSIEARFILPGHGKPDEDKEALIKTNLRTFQQISDLVFNECHGLSTEALCLRICKELAISLNDIARYFLHRCTVMAYLSHLESQGHIHYSFENNELIWRRS